MNKRVHLLIDKSRIVDYSLLPLKFNKNSLYGRGYNLSFFFKPTKKCLTCDILILFSKPVLEMLNEKMAIIEEPSPTLDLLIKARKYSNKVIWMDTSDSTSVTHFELLPFIDLYLKKQLFKDKTLYKKNFYGGRIFTQFYHDKFSIIDSNPFNQFFTLEDKYFDKVNISWNIGLGDMYSAFSKNKLIPSLISKLMSRYYVKYTLPLQSKSKDLFLKTSTNLERELIGFHRKELIKRLDEIIIKNKLVGIIQGKMLSTKKLREAMADSKIIPSPFGWGEIGVRDYEAFINGSVLLKPDISHLSTWPEIFIENKTYQPFKWDFSNLEEVIINLLEDEKQRINIANNGQNYYKDSISKDGMSRFCDWFINQIEK
ncbi:MAG: hypothetical protein WC644_01445 [Ignavibacteria bacterium]